MPTVVPTRPDAVFGADLPPDLAEIVAAWNSLPNMARAGVLAIVRTALP